MPQTVLLATGIQAAQSLKQDARICGTTIVNPATKKCMDKNKCSTGWKWTIKWPTIGTADDDEHEI